MSVSNENSEIVCWNELFNWNELKEAIKWSKNKKSPGCDKNRHEVMKHWHRNGLGTLLGFYNQILLRTNQVFVNTRV